MRTIKQFLLFLLVIALVATPLCSCDALFNKFSPAETEATTPEATTPEATTPEATTPEVTTPEATTPEATTPEATTPEATAPEATTPEATTPEATTPEATAPEATTPEATAPEATAPEATTPEATTPEATTPEATTPEVTAPETPVPSEATINFDDTANRVEFDTSKQIWVMNGITVTNNKGGSTSNVADYAKPARFYKSSDLIIAYTGMTKIVINCNTPAYATACQASLADTGATVTVDGKVVTIILAEAADSFSFTLSGGQIRVDSITVYTTENAQPEETTPEATTPEETTPAEPEVNEPAADSTLTVEQAIALGSSKDHNTYTEGKYYVTGVITEVYNTTYGNMKITDEAGNILTIYGTYSADGSTRYDKMSVKPVAGDTVTIYGIVGQYNGTAQIKNGWIVEHIDVTPEETTPEETTSEVTPEVPVEPAPEEGTVVGVIKDIAAANGWVDGNNSGRYDSFNLNEYISVSVTATATGSYGVNSGKPYGSPIDNWRIYQNESPAITIAAAAGKTIVSVKVTYDVSKTGILTLNGANVESATLVEVNANSITFGVGNTDAATTNGQVRITAIEVTYANEAAAPEETTPEATTPEETTPEVTPEETTPECNTTPEEVTTPEVTPEETTPECNTTPEEVTTPEVTPEETTTTPETPDEPEIQTQATINFDDKANRIEFDTSKQIWVMNGITVTNNRSTSTSGVADYAKPARFYKDSTVIIAYTGMTKIVINCNTSAYANACQASLADTGATVTVSGKVVTIILAEAADSFSFTLSGGQIRVDSITVYTTENAQPEETTPEETTPEVPEVNEPAADSTLTVEQAIALGSSKDHNTYTSGKYYVTGVITEVYNITYGNMKIKDEAGNILTIYGTYSADGSTRYDKMEVQPVAGDTVTIYGIVGQYNGTAQIKNGWIVEHIDVTPEETTPEETTPEVTPEETTPEETTPEVTVPGEPITASKTVVELINEYGWTSSTTKQEFNLDNNVTVKINGGNNTGKAYDGDHIRVYATDTPAGTITISVAEGYELVAVKISAQTGTYAFLYVDGETTDICNESIAVSGSSVVLNSVKNGTSGKQIRVTAFEVIYKAVA